MQRKKNIVYSAIQFMKSFTLFFNEIIKINNISFKVKKNIPRCVAINLKPKTDDNSLNLLQSLKKTYNHFDMGIYLSALEDGKINVGDKIQVSQ